MALSIVYDTAEIKKFHYAFQKLMRSNSSGKPKHLWVNTRGGGWDVDAYCNNENEIWWSNSFGSKENKFYNWIGKYANPDKGNRVLIEINYQMNIKNFREAAIWAKDEKENVFLLHSGRMGGGVQGINYENIDKIYSGARSLLEYYGKEYEYYTICELHSKHAYQQVESFVNEIERIKDLLKENIIITPSGKKKFSKKNLKTYSPEFWGKRKSYYLNAKISSTSNHGFIVDCLQKAIRQEFGISEKSFVKNKYIDLGIVKNKKPFAIFEIKPSSNTQSIYTAIGQLMLHSVTAKTNPARYIVLPSDLDEETEKDLAALSINTIRFSMNKKNVHFTNLNNYF